jgi:hypothetical protein
MPRLAPAAALCAILLAAGHASAQKPARAPDAAQIRQAAEQFDAGIAAFKQRDFAGAASRFEAADAAVPSPQALRQAIRARVEAGQGSRAATLAAQALERYPGDEPTVKLARETIDKQAPLLFKVSVSCASPCVLAVGTRSVPGEANTRWVVYLDPGNETLSASFFGGVAGTPQKLTAKAGGSVELRLEPEEKKAGPGPAAPPRPEKEPAAPDPPKDPPADEPKGKGISPVFFVIGAVATVGLGATTIWSGVDTKKDPGVDAVKAACAGKGEECPLYKEGRSKQTRTNVLIGVSAGTAAATILLGVFTNWGGSKKSAQASDRPGAVRDRAAWGSVQPAAWVLDRGGALGAGGVF